ncbi:MAG: hypothetical protein QG599_878 [Pseudomonadota bacterium]|nr:hypothetical protein [Pseudomonadota bacterium]
MASLMPQMKNRQKPPKNGLLEGRGDKGGGEASLGAEGWGA